MALAKFPVMYSVENTTNGTVARYILVTEPGKFSDYSVLSDEPVTETDFLEKYRNVFDDTDRALGYMQMPSQVADKYDFKIVEEVTPEQIETMKMRFASAKTRPNSSE